MATATRRKRFVMLHKLLVLALLLSPSVALADKDFSEGTGGTWDCAEDATVNINHGNGTYTITGVCDAINLNGGSSTLTVESVKALNVNGAKNALTVGTLGAANIVGAKNKLMWKKAAKGKKPVVNVVGAGNSVSKIK